MKWHNLSHKDERYFQTGCLYGGNNSKVVYKTLTKCHFTLAVTGSVPNYGTNTIWLARQS